MSNGPVGIKWRCLIVEDLEDKVQQLLEIAPTFVNPPDEVEVDVCKTFKKAAGRLRTERFDLLILDLKDDSDTSLDADSNPAGLPVFEELKKTRFMPIIFYTALAHKVRSEETSFIRVVEKTEDVTKVRDEVRRVLGTNLPTLSRHLEDVQRSYMWDFVSTHWKEFDTAHEQVDIAYLLARRLALSLQGEARRMAQKMAGTSVPIAELKNIHPMEMYVHPPISTNRLAGDIVKESTGEKPVYWLVLTPSCDFEQAGRLNSVLLAQCIPLTSESEYLKWLENPTDNLGQLKSLIGDRRQGVQSERFKFLPGTYFLPDSVVDFQKVKAISPDDLSKMEIITSLDSPFAEAILARFSRYFGRLGTPDVDKNVVITRLQAAVKKNVKEQGPQPPQLYR
jgi:DNA-binding response OmpR family regulator